MLPKMGRKKKVITIIFQKKFVYPFFPRRAFFFFFFQQGDRVGITVIKPLAREVEQKVPPTLAELIAPGRMGQGSAKRSREQRETGPCLPDSNMSRSLSRAVCEGQWCKSRNENFFILFVLFWFFTIPAQKSDLFFSFFVYLAMVGELF